MSLKDRIILWELQGILKSLKEGKWNIRSRLAVWAAKREGAKMLEGLKSKMDGYKVYIASVAGILGAIASWQAGAITAEKAIEVIWIAIIAMSGRNAISKLEK